MHAWELEQLAVSLYERLDFDPLRPPGVARLAFRHWGVSGSFRYQTTPAPFVLSDDGWQLTLPVGADTTAMNMGLAVALASHLAPYLGADDWRTLGGALILPMPAARRDVLVYGRDAETLTRAYHIPLDVAEYRIRQVIDHGSGERPSVNAIAAAKQHNEG